MCDMNKSMTLVLIYFLLACSSLAAPLQLSGNSGKAILGAINLTNSTNDTNITDETELWNWGSFLWAILSMLLESWPPILSMTMV